MWKTVLITVVCVAVEFVLGFALALLLVKNFRGRGIVFVFFLLPMMVVPAVSGFIFFMLYQLDGPVNGMLSAISGKTVTIEWLQNSDLAIWSRDDGGHLAVDAAHVPHLPLGPRGPARGSDERRRKILGAGFWHQLRYLIVPMMKPILLIAIIIRAIEAFKMFDPIYLLTRGGPGEATTNISIYLFDETAENTRWGYASSVAILVLIFVSIVGFWAIRPIERAQEETLEELTTAEAPAEGAGPRVEEAIEAEARI